MKYAMRQAKTQELLKMNLSFPDFLMQLRIVNGHPSRKVVSDETQITQSKIVRLESGNFVRVPPVSILKTLADYYHVPYEMLRDSAVEYIKSKRKCSNCADDEDAYCEIMEQICPLKRKLYG